MILENGEFKWLTPYGVWFGDSGVLISLPIYKYIVPNC